MAQESYADYSIIHKYMEQQKLHDEETQRLNDRLAEVEERQTSTTAALEKAQAELRSAREATEKLNASLAERDNEIRRLNSTINNLNKKIAAMTKGARG